MKGEMKKNFVGERVLVTQQSVASRIGDGSHGARNTAGKKILKRGIVMGRNIQY